MIILNSHKETRFLSFNSGQNLLYFFFKWPNRHSDNIFLEAFSKLQFRRGALGLFWIDQVAHLVFRATMTKASHGRCFWSHRRLYIWGYGEILQQFRFPAKAWNDPLLSFSHHGGTEEWSLLCQNENQTVRIMRLSNYRNWYPSHLKFDCPGCGMVRACATTEDTFVVVPIALFPL